MVALRLDRCCPTYELVPRADAQGNECILPVPASPILGSHQVKRCENPDMVACDAGPCPERGEPPARLAVASDGRCRYADECQTDADCVVAKSLSGCCGCPEPVPAVLLGTNACLLRAGDVPDASLRCAACDLPVNCGQCPAAGEPRCIVGEPFNRCRAANE